MIGNRDISNTSRQWAKSPYTNKLVHINISNTPQVEVCRRALTCYKGFLYNMNHTFQMFILLNLLCHC